MPRFLAHKLLTRACLLERILKPKAKADRYMLIALAFILGIPNI
jgi:hypothetical protein